MLSQYCLICQKQNRVTVLVSLGRERSSRWPTTLLHGPKTQSSSKSKTSITLAIVVLPISPINDTGYLPLSLSKACLWSLTHFPLLIFFSLMADASCLLIQIEVQMLGGHQENLAAWARRWLASSTEWQIMNRPKRLRLGCWMFVLF